MNNTDRAERAARLVAKGYDDDEQTNVRDLITDLMHLCESRRYDFTDQCSIAADNFNAELWDSTLNAKATESTRANTNCLHGIRCPHCAQQQRFLIEAVVTADVTDDGCDFHGDATWDDNSHILCPDCEYEGKVGDFQGEA